MSEVSFRTYPSFVNEHFPYLRQELVGQWQHKQAPPRPYYLIEFKIIRQPKLDLSRNLPSSPSPVLTISASAYGVGVSFWDKVLDVALGLLIALSTIVLTVIYGPKLYYALFPGQIITPSNQVDSPAEQQFVVDSKDEQQQTQLNPEDKPQRYLPPQDESLPEGNWLVISKIGVNSQLQRTEDEDEALDTGLWWVPNFGQPGEFEKPMIVAGHRFGWRWWWESDYWRRNSFYRLPELKPGDMVEVISNQRKWRYQIYQAEEGAEITDYEADLILYTCKHLNSPIRYFRYAKLVTEE